MAASVAMALDPAVRQDAQNEATAEETPSRHEPEEIGAALALVSVAKETRADDTAAKAETVESSSSGVSGEEQALVVDVTEDDSGEAEMVDAKAETETPAVVEPMEEAPVAHAASAKVTEVPPAVLTSASSAAVAAALAIAVPEGKTSRPHTPTSTKSKKAENALGIPTSKKKKTKKKKPEAMHPCVGLYIDALDKNRNWGNARILEVDVANEKIKITFPGFSKNWDLWTDLLSIAPHGAEALPPKGLNSKSWDGFTDLFTGQRIAGADPNASPEVLIKQELNIAPSKPLRVKKGYKLEIIPESEADTAALKQSSKRKLPAARESPAPIDHEASVQTPPSSTKRSRVVKIAPGPSPKTAASPINAPLSDPELVRQRNENRGTIDQSTSFLSRCVDVWKKQLLSLTEPQREALLSDETPAYVDL